MTTPTPNNTDEQTRPKNTDVAWFKQHVRIGKRLEREAKRLAAQRQKEQSKHGNS